MDECKRIRRLLALRPDEWTDEERRRVEAHLGSCHDCERLTLAYAEQDRLLRQAPRASQPAVQREALSARFGGAGTRPVWRTRLSGALATLGALAVLAVLAVGLSLLFRQDGRPVGSQPPSPTAVSSDIADLLRNPPPAGQAVEVDAYYSGVAASPMIGPPAPADQVVCPTNWTWQVALTDRPFPGTLQYLSTTTANVPPDEAAWLAAATPEGTQPGKMTLPQLPFHGRLRGHLGDPAFAACPHAGRIFVVDQVVATYQEQPPEPQTWTLAPPQDYAAWPRYHDRSLGYSLPYPPDWSVELRSQPDLAAAVILRAPQWPDYPVVVQVHAGETRYDQYDPTSVPALLQGESFGVFEQGWAFQDTLESQHLAGFQVERRPAASREEVSALFSAGGYTYELVLRFPLGMDASQPLLADYTALVEGFRLDTPPGPTPTAPVKQSLGAGPFLGQDEALARLRDRGEGQGIELVSAELVSEAEARQGTGPCSTFFGHPDGVWLLTVRGTFENLPRTMFLYLDATTGEQLCGEEITPDTTPWPTLPVGTTATPAPAPTAVPIATWGHETSIRVGVDALAQPQCSRTVASCAWSFISCVVSWAL